MKQLTSIKRANVTSAAPPPDSPTHSSHVISYHPKSLPLPETMLLSDHLFPCSWKLTSGICHLAAERFCLISHDTPVRLVRTTQYYRKHHPHPPEHPLAPDQTNHFKALHHQIASYLTELVQPHPSSHALWCLPICPFAQNILPWDRGFFSAVAPSLSTICLWFYISQLKKSWLLLLKFTPEKLYCQMYFFLSVFTLKKESQFPVLDHLLVSNNVQAWFIKCLYTKWVLFSGLSAH